MATQGGEEKEPTTRAPLAEGVGGRGGYEREPQPLECRSHENVEPKRGSFSKAFLSRSAEGQPDQSVVRSSVVPTHRPGVGAIGGTWRGSSTG